MKEILLAMCEALLSEQRSDYDALLATLNRQFSTCAAASLQRPSEPLRELADNKSIGFYPLFFFFFILQLCYQQPQMLLAHLNSLLQVLEPATEEFSYICYNLQC